MARNSKKLILFFFMILRTCLVYAQTENRSPAQQQTGCSLVSPFTQIVSCQPLPDGLALRFFSVRSTKNMEAVFSALGSTKVQSLTIERSPYLRDFDVSRLLNVPCLAKLHALRLRQLFLQSFPHNFLVQLPLLSSLEIAFCSLGSLPEVPPRCCDGAPIEGGLTSLNITQNRIAYLHSENFARLTQLVELDLSWNMINTLPPQAFAALKNLRTLSLQGNSISDIDDTAFADCERLQYLDLSFNPIGNSDIKHAYGFSDGRHTPPSQLPTSTSRGLKNPTLSSGVFKPLKELVSLDMRRTGIVHVPPGISQLKKLKLLWLSQNVIQYLSTEPFQDLTSLVMLDLSYNRIQYFTADAMSKLTELTSLNLAANPLKELPLGLFTSLKKLVQLDLRYTYIDADTDALSNTQTNLVPNNTRLLKLLIAPINDNQHHQYQSQPQPGSTPGTQLPMIPTIPGGRAAPSPHYPPPPIVGPPGAVAPPFGVQPGHGLPPRPGLNPSD